MTPPKYIGPNDVPVIRAAVQQMLRDGVPRTDGICSTMRRRPAERPVRIAQLRPSRSRAWIHTPFHTCS